MLCAVIVVCVGQKRNSLVDNICASIVDIGPERVLVLFRARTSSLQSGLGTFLLFRRWTGIPVLGI